MGGTKRKAAWLGARRMISGGMGAQVGVLLDHAYAQVWIDHLRRGDPELIARLQSGEIVSHTAVIGELACGTLQRRQEVLGELRRLPRLSEPSADESLYLVEHQMLWGRGLGWTDVLLLGACRLGGARLWTRDRALGEAAVELNLRHRPG